MLKNAAAKRRNRSLKQAKHAKNELCSCGGSCILFYRRNTTGIPKLLSEWRQLSATNIADTFCITVIIVLLCLNTVCASYFPNQIRFTYLFQVAASEDNEDAAAWRRVVLTTIPHVVRLQLYFLSESQDKLYGTFHQFLGHAAMTNSCQNLGNSVYIAHLDMQLWPVPEVCSEGSLAPHPNDTP